MTGRVEMLNPYAIDDVRSRPPLTHLRVGAVAAAVAAVATSLAMNDAPARADEPPSGGLGQPSPFGLTAVGDAGLVVGGLGAALPTVDDLGRLELAAPAPGAPRAGALDEFESAPDWLRSLSSVDDEPSPGQPTWNLSQPGQRKEPSHGVAESAGGAAPGLRPEPTDSVTSGTPGTPEATGGHSCTMSPVFDGALNFSGWEDIRCAPKGAEPVEPELRSPAGGDPVEPLPDERATMDPVPPTAVAPAAAGGPTTESPTTGPATTATPTTGTPVVEPVGPASPSTVAVTGDDPTTASPTDEAPPPADDRNPLHRTLDSCVHGVGDMVRGIAQSVAPNGLAGLLELRLLPADEAIAPAVEDLRRIAADPLNLAQARQDPAGWVCQKVAGAAVGKVVGAIGDGLAGPGTVTPVARGGALSRVTGDPVARVVGGGAVDLLRTLPGGAAAGTTGDGVLRALPGEADGTTGGTGGVLRTLTDEEAAGIVGRGYADPDGPAPSGDAVVRFDRDTLGAHLWAEPRWKDYIESLSEDQYKALLHWKGLPTDLDATQWDMTPETIGNHRRLNDFLRTGRPPRDPAVPGIVAALDSAIAGTAVPEAVEVFFGLRSPELFARGAGNIGQVMTDSGFRATTLSENVAFDFAERELLEGGHAAVIVRMTLPKGTPGLYTDIGNLNGAEAEILLPRGTSVRITGAELRDGLGNVSVPGGVLYLDAELVRP